MILLDTHALIWWVGRSPELPAGVLHEIERHAKKGMLAVSSMSFWEIAMLFKSGRLRLLFDLDTWVDKVVSIPNLEIIPPDHAILIQSVLLPEPFHKDPADRIIVASAMKRGATVMTRDEKIRRYPHVRTFWEG